MTSKNLINATVVIVAKQFNPSIFSQLWLVRNGIVSEDEFLPRDFVFSDAVAKVEGKSFGLLVVPPQLQFEPRVPEEQQSALVEEKVGGIVRALPHTPYAAVGLNFTYQLDPEDESFRDFSRRLFGVTGTHLFADFREVDDAVFGGYMSRNLEGCRLRLDAKPVSTTDEEGSRIRLQLAFNYQADIANDDSVSESDDSVIAIERHLRRWESLKQDAERIVTRAVNNLEVSQ